MTAITVLPYDPEWPLRFEAERALLAEALAPWLAGGIHHIGSTSVPGLAAKPIIDMMAGVADLAAAAPAIDVLRGLSYVHAPHRPRAYWFHKPADRESSTHGLHLTEPGSDLWQERLAFRDALRADPELRDRYQELKLRLAGEEADLRGYTDAKRPFVAGVLAARGIVLPPRRGELATGDGSG